MKRIVVMFIIVILVLAGCGNEPDERPNNIIINPIESGENAQNGEEQDEATEYIEGEDPNEYVKTESEVFLIENAFCNLYYPTKWEDKVEIQQSEEGNSVAFYALLGNKKIPVFEIVFNMDGDVALGTVVSKEGNVYVCLNDMYDEWPEDLSESEMETLTMMSEDMNVLISKLVYESGMVLEGET